MKIKQFKQDKKIERLGKMTPQVNQFGFVLNLRNLHTSIKKLKQWVRSKIY